MRPLQYNLDLPEIMSFHLVPHLPRLDTMDAKFLCMKEKLAI